MQQVKNMFRCKECDETFGFHGNFIDGNGTGCYHGAQVSSISEDVLELDNLSSKSSIFTICPRKVLDFY